MFNIQTANTILFLARIITMLEDGVCVFVCV